MPLETKNTQNRKYSFYVCHQKYKLINPGKVTIYSTAFPKHRRRRDGENNEWTLWHSCHNDMQINKNWNG